MRSFSKKEKWFIGILVIIILALVIFSVAYLNNEKTLGASTTVKYAIPHKASYKCEPVQDKYGISISIPKEGAVIDKTDVGFFTNGITNIKLSFTNSYWSTDWATRAGYAICDANGNNCGAYQYITDWIGGAHDLPVNSIDFTRESLKLLYQRIPFYVIGGWQNSEGLKVSFDGKVFGLRLYSTTQDPAGAIICSTSCNLDCPDIGYRQKIVLPKPTELSFYQTAPYLEYWEKIDYDLNQQGGATIYNSNTNKFCFAGTVYNAGQMTLNNGITYIYPDTNTKETHVCCPGARISSTYSDQVCQNDYTWKVVQDTDKLTCISDVNCPGSGNNICQDKSLSGYSCANKDANNVGICQKSSGIPVDCCLNLDCVRDQVCDLTDHKCKGGTTLPVCGDGKLDAGEECDLGPQNGQNGSNCTSVCKKVCVGTNCNPSNLQCDSCWAWAKDKMGVSQSCDIGIFQQIWDSLSCPFYFLKLAILLIASILGIFFGQQFISKFKVNTWITWIIGLAFGGLVFFIGYLFLTWYFVIPAIIIIIVGNIILNMIPGANLIRNRKNEKK